MSHALKVLWIVIGSIFALGLVLAAVGFALGASGSAWFDSHGLHFGSRENSFVELTDTSTAPFENIDVALIEADVEILVGNDYGYEFTYLGMNQPEVSVRNGTLKVTEQNDNWRINIFGFWSWRNWSILNTSATLKVFVPKDADLKNVGLSTASGDTILNSNQINIKNLDCKSVSGNVLLSNLDLERLTLDLASGDVDLINVTARRADINLMSGNLTYRGAKLDSLTLNIASGDMDLEGVITDLLQLRMLSGNANILLTGSQDDYSFDVRRLSGTIRINGRTVHGDYDLPGTSSIPSASGRGGHIEIDTTSGDVDIDFR